MQKKTLTIINKLGLHTRAASKLVELTSKYKSTINLVYNNKKVNGKSIIAVMTLAACYDTQIEIIIDGEDEAELMSYIEKLFRDRFQESE
ncbi:MAG: HPr family phosphocarrier protein [Gammaproteobacteria bacterium]|nr:HPr family phosphocarrier protein [Gammaproteobacteria bacterium]